MSCPISCQRPLPEGPEITFEEVKAAQQSWCKAIVAIGKAGEGAGALAEKVAKETYAFELGPILFKPTFAFEVPFRPDLQGALSYFVGGDPHYPEDRGFALRPWTKVRFDNHGVRLQGNIAMAMGHCYLTDLDGREVEVEFTNGYLKLADGRVVVFLQHFSLPANAR